MLPDRVLNPGPLTYESGALPIALRGPAVFKAEIPIFHTIPHDTHTHFQTLYSTAGSYLPV